MRRIYLLYFLLLFLPDIAQAGNSPPIDFPRPLESYPDQKQTPLLQVLQQRIKAEPFNLVATGIFLLAIIHTFFAPYLTRLAHHLQNRKEDSLRKIFGNDHEVPAPQQQSIRAALLHFFGEVETVFGLWVVPLGLVLVAMKGATVARTYLNQEVDYTEALFVVVIMAIASTRPILQLTTRGMAFLAGTSSARWWLTLLTCGPLLGSFITEPAAMTICALLLGREFYRLGPSLHFRYATLGLLFVNISVGGTLTHFAAPPVLMVAEAWGWNLQYMLLHFGWRAALGIVFSTGVYFLYFRKEFIELDRHRRHISPEKSGRTTPIPSWVTAVHIAFMVWTVLVSQEPALFIGGFLFFIGFTLSTLAYQEEMNLRGPLLVGFFLAGLVIHGGLQAWWIEPVLSRLSETPLLLGATVLTSFNDNAAITYLATLVPNFSAALKDAVVGGAVCGGGLTVIANAPNPAGQSLLQHYFPDGVSAIGLFLAALIPTGILLLCFLMR